MLTFSEIQKFKKLLNGKWDPTVERCGLIHADGTIVETINISPTPENNFEFEMHHFERDVIATWHSHPTTSANLSIDDFWFFKSWPDLTHFITDISEVRCFINFESQVYLVHAEKDYPSRALG